MRYTAMTKDNVRQFEGREAFTTDALTQLLKSGVQQMLEVAIEAEVQDFMLQFQEQLLDDGRSAVVRNGHQPERDLQTGIGPEQVCFT
ncbi:MAG: putative transposase [Granulosicoccus sp.]|jgi:putative transposase